MKLKIHLDSEPDKEYPVASWDKLESGCWYILKNNAQEGLSDRLAYMPVVPLGQKKVINLFLKDGTITWSRHPGDYQIIKELGRIEHTDIPS